MFIFNATLQELVMTDGTFFCVADAKAAYVNIFHVHDVKFARLCMAVWACLGKRLSSMLFTPKAYSLPGDAVKDEFRLSCYKFHNSIHLEKRIAYETISVNLLAGLDDIR